VKLVGNFTVLNFGLPFASTADASVTTSSSLVIIKGLALESITNLTRRKGFERKNGRKMSLEMSFGGGCDRDGDEIVR